MRRETVHVASLVRDMPVITRIHRPRPNPTPPRYKRGPLHRVLVAVTHLDKVRDPVDYHARLKSAPDSTSAVSHLEVPLNPPRAASTLRLKAKLPYGDSGASGHGLGLELDPASKPMTHVEPSSGSAGGLTSPGAPASGGLFSDTASPHTEPYGTAVVTPSWAAAAAAVAASSMGSSPAIEGQMSAAAMAAAASASAAASAAAAAAVAGGGSSSITSASPQTHTYTPLTSSRYKPSLLAASSQRLGSAGTHSPHAPSRLGPSGSARHSSITIPVMPPLRPQLSALGTTASMPQSQPSSHYSTPEPGSPAVAAAAAAAMLRALPPPLAPPLQHAGAGDGASQLPPQQPQQEEQHTSGSLSRASRSLPEALPGDTHLQPPARASELTATLSSDVPGEASRAADTATASSSSSTPPVQRRSPRHSGTGTGTGAAPNPFTTATTTSGTPFALPSNAPLPPPLPLPFTGQGHGPVHGPGPSPLRTASLAARDRVNLPPLQLPYGSLPPPLSGAGPWRGPGLAATWSRGSTPDRQRTGSGSGVLLSPGEHTDLDREHEQPGQQQEQPLRQELSERERSRSVATPGPSPGLPRPRPPGSGSLPAAASLPRTPSSLALAAAVAGGEEGGRRFSAAGGGRGLALRLPASPGPGGGSGGGSLGQSPSASPARQRDRPMGLSIAVPPSPEAQQGITIVRMTSGAVDAGAQQTVSSPIHLAIPPCAARILSTWIVLS